MDFGKTRNGLPIHWEQMDPDQPVSKFGRIAVCGIGSERRTLGPAYNEFGYNEHPTTTTTTSTHLPLADLRGGAPGTRAPWVQFLSFSCSFQEKMAK